MSSTAKTDRYDAIRRDEHSTYGDSVKRFKRDPDAFTAGVQHGLDKMLNHFEMETYRLLSDPLADYIVSRAADILRRVHDGNLS